MMVQMQRICFVAIAAGLCLTSVGCNANQAMQPEVEWMLPDDGGSEVVSAPGLGASDALGHEIFIQHEQRIAQVQLVTMLAAADAGTLWIDQTPTGGFDPFFDLRFAGDEPGDAPVVTDVEGGFFDGAIND